MKFIEKIKKSFNSYLRKLEKSNKKEFGSGGLDCCELNKKGK